MQDPEQQLGQGILDRCKPSRSPYAHSYIERYKDNLYNPDGLLELCLIIMLARVSTVLLECRNAHVNRWCRVMALQATDPLLRNLCCNHMLSKVNNRRTLERSMLKRLGYAPPRALTSRLKERKQRKTRGGGGAWRAFVSKRCKGVCKVANASLAEEYWKLTPDERRQLQQAGIQGTLTHRVGGRSFGMVARGIARRAARCRRQERALGLAGISHVNRSMSESLAIRLDDLSEEVKRLRTDSWMLRRIHRETATVETNDLEAWRQNKGVQQRDRAIVDAPMLSSHASSLLGVPHGDDRKVLMMDWYCPWTTQVPRLVTLLQRKALSAQQSLLHRWKTIHMKVKHSTLPLLKKVAQARYSAKPSCFITKGVCLCGTRGTHRWRLHKFVNRCLKAFCSNTVEKAYLANCRIALRVDSCLFTPVAQDDVDHDSTPLPFEKVFMLLVGLMYFTPYRPTYRKLLWSGDVTSQGHLPVRAQDEYLTGYECCASVDSLLAERRNWRARCYLVHESTRPLASLDPRYLELETMDSDDVEAILPRKPSGRGGRMTLRDKCLDDLDNVSEATTSSEEAPRDEDESMFCPSESSHEPSVLPSVASTPVEQSLDGASSDGVGLASAMASPRASPGTDVSSPRSKASGVPSGLGSGASSPRVSQMTVATDVVSDSDHSIGSGGHDSDPPVVEPVHHGRGDGGDALDDDVILADLGGGVRRDADVLETPWGSLRYHAAADELAAQCCVPGHNLPGAPQCKVRKKTTAHPTSVRGAALGQGRCCARLIGWLQTQACHRWHHIHNTPVTSFARRQAIRRWINDQPDARAFAAHVERPQRPGEPEEPPEIA